MSHPRILDDAVALARGLHASGAPAWRVEQAVVDLGRSVGVKLDCFAIPTGLQLSDGAQVRLVRADSGEIDLEARDALERAVRAPAPRAAVRRALSSLEARTGLPVRAELVAHVACATGAALLLDGQVGTVLAGALGGLWLGLLFQVSARLGDGGRLLPVLAAFGATVLAHALGGALPVDLEMAVLSGLLILLPGLGLTIGVAEVAAGHLSAGAARLTGAAVTLLLLGLGATAGSALIPAGGPLAPAPPLWGAVPLGLWLSVGGLVTLFRARRAQLPWVTLGLLLAWALPMLLADLGPTATDFTTAAALGLCGSLLARRRRMPAQVVSLPGILLLVPGGRALRAVDALLRHDLHGVEVLADSLATSGALVAGLLLAGLALPPRGASGVRVPAERVPAAP